MCGSWNFFCGRGKGPIFSANLNFRSGGGGGSENPALPPSFRSIHDIFTYEGFFDNFLLLLLKVDMDDYRIHIYIWLTQSWVIFVMLFSIYLWRVFWQPSFVYRQQLLQALSLSSQWQMMHLFLQTFLNDTQNFLFRVLYGGNSAIIWTEGSKLSERKKIKY